METQTKTPAEIAPLPVAETNVALPAADGRTAVLYSDPEAIASLLKKKIDVDLDGLKPHPPNIFQKTLRIAAYPIAVVVGYIWARKEAEEGMRKFLSEKGLLDDDRFAMPKYEDTESVAKNMARDLGEHEKEIGKYINEILSAPKPPETFVEKAIQKMPAFIQKEHRLFSTVSKNRPRKLGIVFASLFAGTASMGLLLTLSDNKNFMSFGKDSNLDKDVALDR